MLLLKCEGFPTKSTDYPHLAHWWCQGSLLKCPISCKLTTTTMQDTVASNVLQLLWFHFLKQFAKSSDLALDRQVVRSASWFFFLWPDWFIFLLLFFYFFWPVCSHSSLFWRVKPFPLSFCIVSHPFYESTTGLHAQLHFLTTICQLVISNCRPAYGWIGAPSAVQMLTVHFAISFL